MARRFQASSSVHEAIADAAHGVEALRGGAEFFTQAAHMDIDRACIHEVVAFPDFAQELLARLDPASALGQQEQELEFSGRKIDRLAARRDLVRCIAARLPKAAGSAAGW